MTQLRILYSSNALWASSGYGVQGRSLLPRLADLPEVGGRSNIANFAWYGLQGGMHEVDGFRIYPAGSDAYGNDIVQAHMRDFRANVLISLIDVWVMQDTAAKIAPSLWLPWLPIDHDPVPAVVLESLKGAHLPLTYSQWGRDMLSAAGVDNEYIPHGIETDTFRVIHDDAWRSEFRRKYFRDCAHLTVIVAANKGFPDRKAFQVQLRAWASWAEDKPDALLYIHTEPTTLMGGIDFGALTRSLGIHGKTIFPDRYTYQMGLPAGMMAQIYNAADVYLGASMSEGFGIPLIEAQACGVPVVTTDFSAMTELVRWGTAVQPLDRFWTPLNSWQAWPDASGITDALEELYIEWMDYGGCWPYAMRVRAQDEIHDEYGWDTIVSAQWRPLMSRLAEEAPHE